MVNKTKTNILATHRVHGRLHLKIYLRPKGRLENNRAQGPRGCRPRELTYCI